jgi:hypothetical protein
MKRFGAGLIGGLILCLSSFGCAAAPSEDEDQGETEDKVQGSPTEQREKEAAEKRRTYQNSFTFAYSQAGLSAFEAAQANALKGEAATDFATMTRNCTAAKGYKVSAQVWTATGVPANLAATGTGSKVTRKLFTVDAYSSKNKKTMYQAIYEEDGKLLLGRSYDERAFVLSREEDEKFRSAIATCAPPQF